MNQQGNIAAMGAVGGGPGGVNAMGGMANKHPGSDSAQLLNTYIYDYLLRNRHYDLARSFIKSLSVTTNTNPKQSPGQRNVNGVDDSMDTDSKEDLDRPDDLPSPAIPSGNASDNSFLFDWWCQFWDVFAAQRGKHTNNTRTVPYVNFSKQSAQIRNDRNSQLLNAPNFNLMRNMPPGSQAEIQKRMGMMKGNPSPAQLQAMQQAQAKSMMANGMQRDGSGMNMGDQRPQSPANGENVPSPSKRSRLDGNLINNQLGGPGRSQPMQGPPMGATSAPGANQMMMTNGIPQGEMGPNGFAGFGGQGPNGQQKAMEGMNPNGGPPGQQVGVPQGLEGSGDLFAGNANAGRMPGGPNGLQGQQGAGNHALQDYQMQLMLLEQQNKKRLLMARQEQDNLTQAPHPGGVGQPGFGAPAMSPQGSRAGPSPNPADQMKRATPKMNQQGLPGSPMPDGSMPGNRASPIPNGTSFDQMPAGMPPQYYQNGPGGMAGPNSMRPPSSHPNPNFNGPMNQQQQLEAMRQRGQMPNGMWQNPPPQMMNPGQQQQPHMGTPQQRNSAMPPPPAPQTGGEQQRTQPPSPQQNTNAPPTPSQSNKAAPKGKKEKADSKKKVPKKNSTAATGATPASEADQPTPTPSTPITPMHPNSFKSGQQPGNAQNQQQSAQPTQQVAAAPQMDANNQPPFGALDNEANLDLNFGPLDGPDVLETFDFDSFLHTEDNSAFGAFDTSFAFPADGVEAGEGMG